MPRPIRLVTRPLLLVAGSLAVGMLPALTSLVAMLAVVVAALLLLTVLTLRRSASIAPPPPPEPDGHPRGAHAGAAAAESGELRVARLLFYVGCLLVGVDRFRFAGGLTLAEIMFTASFLLCASAALRGRAIVRVPAPVLIAVGVFAVGGAISSMDAQSPPSSAFQLLHAIYVLLLWPAVGALVLRTPRQLTMALALFAVSGAIDGLAATAQLLGLHPLGIAKEGNRMTGFTSHPNDLGGATATALVPALLIAAGGVPSELAVVRCLRWVPAALVAVGLALSGSVTAMGAGGLALVVWLSSPAVRAPSRVAVVAAIVCAVAVVTIAGGQISSPVQRLAQVANPASQSGGSVQDRLAIAVQAWPRIQRDPFIGTGLDTADSAVTIISHGDTTGYQVHGLPLAAVYQAGVFGMLGLVGLLVVLTMLGWRGLAASDTNELMVGFAVLAAFLAFVVVAMTQPMVFQQYGWITAVFIVAWRLRADEPSSNASRGPRRRASTDSRGLMHRYPDRVLSFAGEGVFDPQRPTERIPSSAPRTEPSSHTTAWRSSSVPAPRHP